MFLLWSKDKRWRSNHPTIVESSGVGKTGFSSIIGDNLCCAVNEGAKSDRSQIFHSFYFLSFLVLIGRKGSSAYMSLLLSKITAKF